MLDRVDVEEPNINFRPLIKKKDDSFAKLPNSDVVTLNKLAKTGTSSSKVIHYKADHGHGAKTDALSISNASTNVRSAELDK